MHMIVLGFTAISGTCARGPGSRAWRHCESDPLQSGVADLSLQSRRSAVQQQSYGTSQMARAVLPWPTLARLSFPRLGSIAGLGPQDLESSSFSANRTWGPLFYRETALLAARTWCFGARTGVRGGVRRGRAMGAGDRAGWIIDQAHVS